MDVDEKPTEGSEDKVDKKAQEKKERKEKAKQEKKARKEKKKAEAQEQQPESNGQQSHAEPAENDAPKQKGSRFICFVGAFGQSLPMSIPSFLMCLARKSALLCQP